MFFVLGKADNKERKELKVVVCFGLEGKGWPRGKREGGVRTREAPLLVIFFSFVQLPCVLKYFVYFMNENSP